MANNEENLKKVISKLKEEITLKDEEIKYLKKQLKQISNISTLHIHRHYRKDGRFYKEPEIK